MICKTNRHNSYLLVVVVSILCGISCHIYEISGFCYTRRRSGFSPDILRRQKSIVGRRTKSTQTRRRRRRRSAATIAGVDDTTLFFSDEISSDKAKTRQQSILHIIIEKRKKILLIPPALVVVVLFLPRLLKRQLLPFKGALNYHHISKKLRWNNIARYFFVVLFVSSIFSTINTRRRQSIDPTSEWSRYARRPGARGRAILSLFVKQAFMILTARIVDSIGIDKVAARLRQNAGKTFSNGILKLGPLYIKMGQIVSCREGLLGKEWVNSLAKLQDRVPARSGQKALDLAYSAFEGGKEEFDRIFIDFDPSPLAAASLGQVHRAKLRENGNEIAIKVQRPHLRLIYDQDFKLLTKIAKFMDKLPSASKNVGGIESSWTKIISDAETILYREIDYRDEASNAVRFAENFGLGMGGKAAATTVLARNNETLPSANDWLRTPYIYTNLSNEQILVQEYVPSIKVTDKAKLDAANITQEERFKLADDLARAYLRQFCSNLFFSTDPHPGNIGVEMVSSTSYHKPLKPRIVMYDFGQAATLTQNQADGILEIIEAIIDTDVDRSINAFLMMGVLVDDADLNQIRTKIAENYRTGKIKADRKRLRRKGFKFRDKDENVKSIIVENERKEISSGTSNVTSTDNTKSIGSDAQVMSYFTLPAEYAFVARAISQLDGSCKSLDPEFDFISNAAPYIVEIKGADLYLKDELLKFIVAFQDRIKECLKKIEDVFRSK